MLLQVFRFFMTPRFTFSILALTLRNRFYLLVYTTLQSIMNAKHSLHGFWHCHENGLIKTIQTIPHNKYVSFKLASLYCGLRLILVYPNP